MSKREEIVAAYVFVGACAAWFVFKLLGAPDTSAPIPPPPPPPVATITGWAHAEAMRARNREMCLETRDHLAAECDKTQQLTICQDWAEAVQICRRYDEDMEDDNGNH